ncbi:MAG: radical SAM protein [Proteobacteria bacterium]|nr:radical SAM protein [Pseudomonadota bacterium]
MRKRDFPSLDWIQIEVTSLCGASCFYCPHTIYKDRWRHGSMSLETFKHIGSAFEMAKLIFLQGWGEPFLNEKLFEMIEIAKKVGCKVGLTTNGMALDPETIDHLLDLKLDILGISLAGTKSETHNHLRAGTDFERITQSLMELKEKKAGKNASLPEVHLAYIMLKSNFEDLREIINYAKRVGSKDVVCSNLNFFPSHQLRKEAIFLDEPKKNYYYETLEGLKGKAKENGVNFFFYSPFLAAPMPLCPENILRSCYISHDGLVSSCVFTNMPISGKAEPGHIEGKKEGFPRSILYGNINHQSLSEIWNSDPYKSFRHIFEVRQKGIKEDIALVIDAVGFQVSEKQKIDVRNDHPLGSLPDQCRNCYRMRGV